MTVYVIMKRLYDSWVLEGTAFADEDDAINHCVKDPKLTYKSVNVVDLFYKRGEICQG